MFKYCLHKLQSGQPVNIIITCACLYGLVSVPYSSMEAHRSSQKKLARPSMNVDMVMVLSIFFTRILTARQSGKRARSFVLCLTFEQTCRLRLDSHSVRLMSPEEIVNGEVQKEDNIS